MKSFVTVKKYGSRIEADIAKSMLESEGIKAIVFADDAGGFYPPSIMSSVELKVSSDNIDEAQKLLEIIK